MSAHSPSIVLNESEVEFVAIRAQGAGGQNVNKVSNAIHLRFDIGASSLPAEIKVRLCLDDDDTVAADTLVAQLKQAHRSLERNRFDALARLRELIELAAHVPEIRRPTRPTRNSQKRRVDTKVRRGQVKLQRGRVKDA